MKEKPRTISIHKTPHRLQLTHNCCLKLVVVIFGSADFHLHKGTRNTSSKLGEMASPENLGHQR